MVNFVVNGGRSILQPPKRLFSDEKVFFRKECPDHNGKPVLSCNDGDCTG